LNVFLALERLIGFSVYCHIEYLSIFFSKVKITAPPENNMITMNKNNVLILSKRSSPNALLTKFSGFSTKFAGRINTRIIKIIDPTKKIEVLIFIVSKNMVSFYYNRICVLPFGITHIYLRIFEYGS